VAYWLRFPIAGPWSGTRTGGRPDMIKRTLLALVLLGAVAAGCNSPAATSSPSAPAVDTPSQPTLESPSAPAESVEPSAS